MPCRGGPARHRCAGIYCPIHNHALRTCRGGPARPPVVCENISSDTESKASSFHAPNHWGIVAESMLLNYSGVHGTPLRDDAYPMFIQGRYRDTCICRGGLARPHVVCGNIIPDTELKPPSFHAPNHPTVVAESFVLN